MLKYSPQYMLTKDVASAYVMARRGLGLKEKVPMVYRDLLNRLQNNLYGTSGGIPNPWQVLKVVMLTALSSVQGLWEGPVWALAPAAGSGGGSPVRGLFLKHPEIFP